jgi:PAS domain S-box-containing protein
MTFRFELLGNRPPGPSKASGENLLSPEDRFNRSLEIKLRRWTSLTIIFTLVLISLMGYLAWQSTRRGEASELWVVHTLSVDEVLESGLSHAIATETQARGFAATGMATFLSEKKDQQEELARDVAEVRHLTSDNASQQQRMDVLESRVNAINQSEKNLDDERLRTGKGPSNQELLFERRLLDAVRLSFAEMRREEARLLAQRVATTEQTVRMTRTTILSGTLLAIFSLTIAESLILFQLNRSVRIQKRLRAEELGSAESRRAEGVARETSRYARSLIEASLDPLVTISRNGKITDVNEAAIKVTGTSRESLIGSDFSDFYTDPESARHAYEQAFAEGAVKDYPLSIRDAEGNVTDVLYNASVFRDEAGQVQGVFASARDITERKRAEAALRESEERFRLLVDPVKEYAIYMLDPEGHVVTWNAGAERCKGYTAAEVMSRHVSMFFLPEDAEAGLPAKELATAEREGRFETEGWRKRKDGTKFWALVTLTATYRQDGTLRGFAKVTRDLTVQKKAEDALLTLNAQLERYRIFVENIDEYAIYTLDPEGMITSWGTGAQKVSGAGADKVMGRHYSMFFPPNQVLAGVPQKELAEAARSGRFMTDAWMASPDGKRKWSSGVLNAVRDESGTLTGFIRVARDMTKQKLLEEEMERLKADLEIRVEERTKQLESTVVELRHKNEEVEAFVYIVSHDLRAPLVNLMGFARELQADCARLKTLVEPCVLSEVQRAEVSGILNSDLPSSVHFISQSSVKFERLIDSLLMLSRHGRQIYRIVDLNVGEVVAEAVATFRQQITEAGATVDVGYLPSVKGDLTSLGQVFSNLIGNSLKYRSPDRPLKLEIGGRVEDGTVNYWVRDNGLGIPETGKARLFQVFQRFHPQQAQGEGMGLAIAHRIVERHGGRIWAESREGEGTTFRFSLPGNGVLSIPGSGENIMQEAIVHGSS